MSSLERINNERWEEMKRKAIKVWHFEKCKDGKSVKPVEGEYDPKNPNHVKKSKIIKINQGLL